MSDSIATLEGRHLLLKTGLEIFLNFHIFDTGDKVYRCMLGMSRMLSKDGAGAGDV
jgi:hypothetical protein